MDQFASFAGSQQTALGAAFACGALAALAIGVALFAAAERHPQLADAFRARREEDGLPFAIYRWLADVGGLLARSDRLANRRQAILVQLIKAGRPSTETPETFLGSCIAQGVLVAIFFIGLALAVWGEPRAILAIGAGAVWAFAVRPFQLAGEADGRVRQINRRLPFAIDLAILVLEAGGTLSEAMTILARSDRQDPFAEEMRLVLEGMKAGHTQARALEDMAKRLEIEDLATLVMAINRGEQMGTSMKQTLQTQAELMRERRYQRAEKIAAEAPVKMMLPNMLIMMATLLVVLGPMLLKMAKSDL